MKALDVLQVQRDSLQQAAERWNQYAEDARKDPTCSPGPETCQRRADEFAAKVVIFDRIAKAVEAAQAWKQATSQDEYLLAAEVLYEAVATLDELQEPKEENHQ